MVLSSHGPTTSRCRRGRSAPYYAAWQRSASDPHYRGRSLSLSGIVAATLRIVLFVVAGLLSDVESRTPDRGSPNGAGAGSGPATHPRALCGVLERPPVVERPRVARAI